MESRRAKSLISKLILSQLVMLLALMILVATLFGREAAYSWLVGGLIWLLPNYYLAEGIVNLERSLKPSDRLRKIYISSVIKILYSVALFVITIVLLQVDFKITVAAYLTLTLTSGISFRRSESSIEHNKSTTFN